MNITAKILAEIRGYRRGRYRVFPEFRGFSGLKSHSVDPDSSRAHLWTSGAGLAALLWVCPWFRLDQSPS